MNLYKVKVRSHRFEPFYVIAEDAGEAYRKVKSYLDIKDYGFLKERELDSIDQLAAETGDMPKLFS